jgi:hypothetical protein
MDVRYAFTREPIQADRWRATTSGAHADDPYFVHESIRPLERFRLVYDAVVVSSPDDALALIDTPAFDPERTVILERGDASGTLPGNDRGAVSVDAYENDCVRVTIDAPTAGWLVRADNYSSAWSAPVDGRSADILPAYTAFQAVAVPAGTHVVEFRCGTGTYTIGWLIALAALACAAGFVWTYEGVLSGARPAARKPRTTGMDPPRVFTA